MNAFIDELNEDLNDAFFDLDEFGETVIYKDGGVDPGVTIQGLYDARFSSAGTIATEEVVDHMPHLTLREIDLAGGKVKASDRFVVRGKNYRPVDDGSNFMQVIRCFLHEVE